jgi:hypothetical protein
VQTIMARVIEIVYFMIRTTVSSTLVMHREQRWRNVGRIWRSSWPGVSASTWEVSSITTRNLRSRRALRVR